MAEEQDSSQEKSQEPTEKRKKEAREKGEVPRSRELTTTVLLLSSSLGLMALFPQFADAFIDIIKFNYTLDRNDLFDPKFMQIHFASSLYHALLALLPFFLITLIAATIGPIMIGGWLFSVKSIAPKASRLNPGAGLKRMFSIRSLVELSKALMKFFLVATVAYLVIESQKGDIFSIDKKTPIDAMIKTLEIIGLSILLISSSMIVVTLIDVPFQIWQNQKKLKMTHQQIKDEYKNTEGKPEVKSRVRQLQHEISQRRMMSDVPEADVIITNPTHFSVALKYNPDAKEKAPSLVAKGSDLVAFKIREVAKAHDVLIITEAPLTRAIFYSTEIGQEIPAGLYVAVAQILAYVYQLRLYKKGEIEKPIPPHKIDIPSDYEK